ncbi:MAG TPA: hypothetical protein VES03_06880 [Motilibacterales bacterium]|nr:hypothetical protein [Motilibacterales bacterium]
MDSGRSVREVHRPQRRARPGRPGGRTSRNDLYASIQHRKNHSLDEAYVTMPLRVFVQVMAPT